MTRRIILIILLMCWSIKTQAESFVDLSSRVVWGRKEHYDPGCENITGWIIINEVDWYTYQPPVCDVYFTERHRSDAGITWVDHECTGHFFLRNFHIIAQRNE